METCIYNIAEICWGKKEPRPGLFVTPTWCEVSDNLIYSPIHQVFPGANTAVTGVLGGRWRTGRWEPWGGGRGDGIGCYLFLGPRRHEKHERFAQQLHEVINIFFLTEKNTSFFRQLAPLHPGLTLVRRWWEGPLLFWWHCSHIHLGAGPQSRPLSLIIIIL